MTDRQLNNRMKKLQELDAQIKQLTELADALKDEIKADLEEKNENEHNTGSFVIRWKLIQQRKLDNTALKQDLPDVYEKYSKDSSYMRFSYKAS